MAGAYDEGTATTKATNPPQALDFDDTGNGSATASDSGMHASIGHYALVAKLGQGGMADVHLAVDRGPIDDFHKLVVLKRLRASLRSDREYVDMFLKEARIAARLSHPNVVQTYAVEVEHDRTCIVMEYLDGVSLSLLHKRMRDRPLRERMLLMGALSEALAGLEYVHSFKDYDGRSLGLVHRDIKPGNIIVTFDGHVKLLDFGVAKATETDNTASMAIKGTARYMAPEMVGQSPKIDRRADVFSAGVMLWELASGKKLWEDVNNLQILRRLADNDVPTVESVSDDVLPELSRICRRALQCDPEQRYPSAAEFKADLDTFLHEQGVGSVGPDLARIAAEEFGDLRAERAEAIRTRLEQLSEAGGAVTTTDVPVFSSGSNSSVPGPGATEVVSTSIPRRRRTRWAAWAAVGTVLVLAAAGVTYGAFDRESSDVEASEPATRPDPAAPVAAPPAVEAEADPTTPVVEEAAEAEEVEEVEELAQGETEAEPVAEAPKTAKPKKARSKRPAAPVKKAKTQADPAGVEPGQLPSTKSKRKSKLTLDKDDPWK
jgi:serine/threonine protein kinase